MRLSVHSSRRDARRGGARSGCARRRYLMPTRVDESLSGPMGRGNGVGAGRRQASRGATTPVDQWASDSDQTKSRGA
jgi:hypothetical protein